MKRPSNLRRRIITATFGLAAVVCALFSVALFGSLEYAEWILFDKHIESDIQSFVSQYQIDPNVAKLPHESFEVYVAPGGDESGLPEYLKGRADNYDDENEDSEESDAADDEEDEEGGAGYGEEENDEVIRDGHEYHLDIRTVAGTTYYFLFDETEFEAFDQLLNVFVPALILLICAVAAAIGWLQAIRISRPVTALAEKVNRLETAPAVPAAQALGTDEIEVLAQAIDGYAARVTELLTREREFSTDVSHELRTPLMGIQAAAENLQVSAITSQRVDELSRRIEARCAQMRALVDAMLTLARDPHSLENDFQDIPLTVAVRQQLDVLASQIEAKKLSVRLVERDQPRLFTSAAILDVVVGNILRNAILHSDSSEIEVRIEARSFTVRDFGRGIPEDMRSRLFERHVSGSGNGARDTGVGLALVKRICAHFRWTLSLESAPEQGTAITVDFGASVRSMKP
ncbi:MAG: HAMP domain-containing histidine kinase [Gammaproteobacteria bacterium]|nr:HAMP domain-containing histidine kinase [Gammaproteobacteria bacterium]